MTGRLLRYVLLAAVVICACAVRIQNIPASAPRAPFRIGAASRTITDSEFANDQILSLNGSPFHAYAQFEDAVRKSKPGARLLMILSEPSGRAIERSIDIPSSQREFSGVVWDVLIPLVCILMGALAVAKRPADRNAWFFLFLMIGVAETASRGVETRGAFEAAWHSAMGGLAPVFLMLFGIYFPEHTVFEKRHPWLKYLLLVPFTVIPLITVSIGILWYFDINAAAGYRTLYLRLSVLQGLFALLAIVSYFLNIGWKSRTVASADARRRLRILLRGTPVFPLAMAYAIVAERAIDLRFLFLRRSREAEQALAQLANEANPQPESTAAKLATILHIADIVILLREGDVLTTRCSTRPGEPMNIDALGGIAAMLHRTDGPLEVYFDPPSSWLRGLTVEELQALDFMRSRLLLPLTAGGKLTGIVSLGAKPSDAPYSKTEIQLLRAIASKLSPEAG